MINSRSKRYPGALLFLLLAIPCFAQPFRQPNPREQQFREDLLKADSLRDVARTEQARGVLERLRSDRELVDPTLRGRALYGLARIHAVSGRSDSALTLLQDAIELESVRYQTLEREPDFARLQSDQRFTALVAEVAGHQIPWARLWLTPERFKVPIDAIDEDLRIAGLSTLWSEVRQNFAWFDRVPQLDWDSLYLAYLPNVRSARGPVEYYRHLQSMCARLRDGHTEIDYPQAIRDSLLYRPALDVRALGDTVIVAGVHDQDLFDKGIMPGQEIVTIDGMEVNEYARRNVVPYQSGFSIQDIRARAYEYRLLSGACSQPVTVGFRSADGEQFTRTLQRNFSEDDLLWMRTSVEGDTLAGNIGYIRITTFYDEYLLAFVRRRLLPLSGTDAMIIDLRENGGGFTDVALQVLGLFMDTPYRSHSWETPLYMPYSRVENGIPLWRSQAADLWQGAGAGAYRKPVVVLTSARTYSAAEHFLVSFRQANRGVLIGQTTGGSTGHALQISLPGEGGLYINTTRDYFPDGRKFNGTGIAADIEVRPTVADFRSGRDAVLATAVDHLQRQLGRPGTVPIVAGAVGDVISVPGRLPAVRDGRRFGQSIGSGREQRGR